MKQIFIITILAAVILSIGSCNAQTKNSFRIKGTLDSGVQTDSVFLYTDNEELKLLASSPVTNGKFELKGSVAEPLLTIILKQDKRGIGRLILENADYTYTYKNNKIHIKGGKLQDIVSGYENSDTYNKAVTAYFDLEAAVFEGKGEDDELSPEEMKQLNEKEDAANAIAAGYLNKVIEDPHTPILAKALAICKTPDMKSYPMEKRMALLETYEKESGGSKTISELLGEYKEMQAAQAMEQTVSAGKMFKDIEATDANGQRVKLSDIVAKNKFTILEFWASWCGPCRGEIPNLKKAYAKYKEKGLEIYALSIDQKNAQWLQALKEENTPWLNLVDPNGFKGEAGKSYGLQGVPASYLIGQDGIIVATDQELRGKDLDKTLNKYMP